MINDFSSMRHSAAHLLAAAVQRLFQKTILGIGPVIEDGFYYDFDSAKVFSGQDFKKIEAEIERLKKEKIPFERLEKPIDEAITLVKKQGEIYKEELIRDLQKIGETKVTFYKTGDFVDLCRGPHVEHSGQVGVVKLLSVAGAYWKGDEKNKMLQRIYGTAWPSKDSLEGYLKRLEESKRRDHKKLGPQLDLFTFSPTAPGMPFWYPKGFLLINSLKEFIRKINRRYGYQEISTPLLAKGDVWETSGHMRLFRENMFIFELDTQTYALKPMNCPETILLYNTRQHSYRELPIKLSDLDTVHRYEDSGTLNGLFRVRELSQDDGHVFCTKDQIEKVVGELLDMASEVYKVFGFTPTFYLATKPAKAMGDEKLWAVAENTLKDVLEAKKVNFDLKSGEGAFYGPKIDLHIEDVLGRDWQLATIQLDSQMPERFGANFVNEKGKKETPIMVHRAILGSFERFLGILIEHYAGAFPLWLAPIQVVVIPVSERINDYAILVSQEIGDSDVRVEVDLRNETLAAKIRDWEGQKVPYMLVVGDKERVQKKAALRSREKKDEGVFNLNKITDRLREEIGSWK